MAALGPRRGRRLPVPRPARPPADRGRRWRCSRSSARSEAGVGRRRALTADRAAAGPAAARPPPRADGARGRAQRLPPRGDDHRRRRCRSRIRANGRPTSARRPTSCTAASPTPTPTSCLPEPVGLPRRAAAGPVVEPVPPAVPARVPQLPAGPGMAGPASRSSARSTRTSGSRRSGTGAATGPPGAPALLAGLLSHIGCSDDGRAGPGEGLTAVRERPDHQGARRPASPIGRGSALANEAAPVGDGGRAGRDQPAVGPDGGAHRTAVGRGASAPIWSSAATASRTGTPAGGHGGRRAGHALRRADRHLPAGRLRPARPGPARELFIRHALVDGTGTRTTASWPTTSRAAEAVRALEDRVRRRDLLIDDGARYELYAGRIPASVISGRPFDRWYRGDRRRPDGAVPRPYLVDAGAGRISFEDYPDTWEHRGLVLALSYVYDPLADDDGVTRARAPRPSQPGERRGLGLAHPRVAVRHRGGPPPVPAEGRAPPLRAGGPTRRASFSRARPRRWTAPRHPVGLGRHPRRCPGEPVPPRRSSSCPRTCASPSSSRTRPGTRWPPPRISTPSGPAFGVRCAQVIADANRSLERSGLISWDLGSLPRTIRDDRRGGGRGRLPGPGRRRATPSGSGCSPTLTTGTASCGAAPGACSCSASPPRWPTPPGGCPTMPNGPWPSPRTPISRRSWPIARRRSSTTDRRRRRSGLGRRVLGSSARRGPRRGP